MMRRTRRGFLFFVVGLGLVTLLFLCFYVHEKSGNTVVVLQVQTSPTPETSLAVPPPSSHEDDEQTNHSVHKKGTTTSAELEDTAATTITQERKGLTLQESVQGDMMKCSLSLGLSEDAIERAYKDTAIMSQKVAEFLQAFWSIVPSPSEFLASYKNPCWHSNIDLLDFSTMLNRALGQYRTLFQLPNSQQVHLYTDVFERRENTTLLCLPYFFVPGFIKAGTTSLYNALVKHPEIAAPEQKEPHWWARLPMENDAFDGSAMKSSITWYLAQFIAPSKNIAAHPNHVSYDGSVSSLHTAPYWLHDQDYCIVPALISRVLPNAKIIILMRNPAERTFSNYLYACTQKYGWNIAMWPLRMGQNAAEVFHEQVVLTIHELGDCLQNHTLFECANQIFVHSRGLKCGEVGFRLTVSLYYTHIVKWMQFYSRDHFLFLKTENMSSDPHKFLTRITQFLSLSPPSIPQAQEWLQEKANAQPFVSHLPQYQMKEETKKLLEEFFRPYNAMLAELVGDDQFYGWTDFTPPSR